MVRFPFHAFLLASSCHAFSSRKPLHIHVKPPSVSSAEASHSSAAARPTFLKYQSNSSDTALPWETEWQIANHPAHANTNNNHNNIAEEDHLDFLLPLPQKAPRIHEHNADEARHHSLAAMETTTTTEKEPMSDVVKARILLIGAAALYGTNFSLVKILGETGMSVGLSSTLRFGFAALVTLPWLLAVDKEENKDRRLETIFDPKSTEFQAAMGGLEVGMWNSIGYVAQAVGLETTSASKSAFLCSLAVVMVPILDYLAGKTLLSRQVIGALLAVVGVAFLELEGGGAGGAAVSFQALSPGDIASLIQPIAFGLGFWRMESAMGKHPEAASRATAAQLLAVFLGSGAYMVGMNELADPTTIPPMDQLVAWVTDPVILGALFWTGVVTTALTIYMETVALKTLSAAETTLIFSTEPLWGTAFASVVMGETLGLNAVAGAVMILSGCFFSNLGLEGLLQFIPGRKKEAIQEISEDIDTSFLSLSSNQNILPTTPVGKFSLKSSLAGALAGIVATIENLPH